MLHSQCIYSNQAYYVITEQFRELAENKEGERGGLIRERSTRRDSNLGRLKSNCATCWNATHKAIASKNFESNWKCVNQSWIMKFILVKICQLKWMISRYKCNCSITTAELVNWGKGEVFLRWWMRVDARVTGHYLASSSMRSCLLMPSGISLGMAATHVRNRSIFGLRSPLKQNTHMY